MENFTIPKLAATSGLDAPVRKKWVWLRPSAFLYDWTQLGPPHPAFRILTVGWGNLLILQLPQTSHKPHLAFAPDNPYKFPCSLNLKGTSLEWSASFFYTTLYAWRPICKPTQVQPRFKKWGGRLYLSMEDIAKSHCQSRIR